MRFGLITTEMTVDEVIRMKELEARDEAKAVKRETKWTLTYCPTCDKLVSSEPKFCPNCGQRLDYDNTAF